MQPERVAFDVLESTPELLARIFVHLDTDEDLARACAVKRSWLASAGADGLWQARCAQSFPLASALKLRTGSTLSYRRLLAQRRASQSVARATPPPPVAQQPNRQDYLLGIEIRKIGSVALYDSVQPITGGAVMFSALVDLDEQGQGPSPLVVDEQSLVASVRGGSTGAVLRAGNCEEEAEPGGAVRGSWSSWDGDYIRHYGDDDGNWGLDLKFHVDAFLVRKSDGETLSLCAGTSAYDSQNWPGGERAGRTWTRLPAARTTSSYALATTIPGMESGVNTAGLFLARVLRTMVTQGSPSLQRGLCCASRVDLNGRTNASSTLSLNSRLVFLSSRTTTTDPPRR
jgi:hypothetical protein